LLERGAGLDRGVVKSGVARAGSIDLQRRHDVGIVSLEVLMRLDTAYSFADGSEA